MGKRISVCIVMTSLLPEDDVESNGNRDDDHAERSGLRIPRHAGFLDPWRQRVDQALELLVGLLLPRCKGEENRHDETDGPGDRCAVQKFCAISLG